MKAMCIDEKKDFVWQDVPDPVCHGEFDVKLKVEACAVNRADLMQRAGIYAPPEGWPLWPGLECAGVVLEAPANGRFKPGDRVCALCACPCRRASSPGRRPASRRCMRRRI